MIEPTDIIGDCTLYRGESIPAVLGATRPAILSCASVAESGRVPASVFVAAPLAGLLVDGGSRADAAPILVASAEPLTVGLRMPSFCSALLALEQAALPMNARVLGAIGDFQIFEPVVRLDAVPVVNDLAAFQSPSKRSLHHNSVFVSPLVLAPDFGRQDHVPGRGDRLACPK